MSECVSEWVSECIYSITGTILSIRNVVICVLQLCYDVYIYMCVCVCVCACVLACMRVCICVGAVL